MAGLGIDLCAKQLLLSFSLGQFVLLRSALGLAMFLLLAPAFGGLNKLHSRRWRWHALRALLAAGAMFGFFHGLDNMPLVNALTLVFTAPLWVTALSMPLLGEHVGWRRWTGVAAGFCGVLIILRPGLEDMSMASVAVLASALCYAGLIISSRHLAPSESSYALSVYLILGPLVAALVLHDPDAWVRPGAFDWLLFIVAAACSVLAWVALIAAYRRAPPSILAPFEYTALVGGVVAGYLIWGEVPDRFVLAGAVVIIGAGLFVVYREINWRKQAAEEAPAD